MYVYGGPGSQTVKDSWGGIICGIKCSVSKVILWFQLTTEEQE